MPSTNSEPEPVKSWAAKVKSALLKVGRLLLVGLLFGFVYDWASPLIYRPGLKPGFWLGSTHGALMPVALPSLLMGKDVPIYANENEGRSYKLGYIAGINVCGFIFFGLSFWQPGRTSGRR